MFLVLSTLLQTPAKVGGKSHNDVAIVTQLVAIMVWSIELNNCIVNCWCRPCLLIIKSNSLQWD